MKLTKMFLHAKALWYWLFIQQSPEAYKPQFDNFKLGF